MEYKTAETKYNCVFMVFDSCVECLERPVDMQHVDNC
jgi:hypothetical protein